MRTLARFAIGKRWIVVGAWVALVVVLQLVVAGIGGSSFKDDFKLPGTETETVSQLLTTAGLDSQNGASGTIVLHARSGALTDVSAKVRPALAGLCTAGLGLASVQSPFGTVDCATGRTVTDPAAQKALTSPDGTTGVVSVNWTDPQPTVAQIDGTVQHFVAGYTGAPVAASSAKAMDQMATGPLQAEYTGQAFTELTPASAGIPPEVIGIMAALIILFLVFRTLGATLLPLFSAAAAIGAGVPLIGLLSHVMSVASFVDQLALLMILGVGIDYALFIVTRHRRNLLRGMSVEDSIVLAVNTSGRAVLFAGTTVCIALLGMWTLGVSFLYGVAVGTAVGVLLTMVASLTLLPALLRFLGLRVLPRRQRSAVRAGRFEALDHERGGWYRWAGLVQRRRVVAGLAAFAFLAVLAVPFFSMRLGASDQGTDPRHTTTRKGYDLIAQGFGPGYNSGLQLVVDGPGSTDRVFLEKLTTTLAAVPDVAPNSVATVPTGRGVTLVTFKSVSSPQAAATTDLVKDLRATVLPPLYSGSASHVYVYGVTAVFVDFAKVLSAKMVLFFTAVIGLSFLLLLVAFRSLVISLTAAVMNLLAAGASFGIVVAIFQWGWLSELLGVGGGGPIEAFIPVIFFAVLFGLSMDYQVFLVSRMHEEWLRTGDNARAITVGQGETGGIITAAGLIMVAVFGGFVLGDQRAIKLFGIGLGSAVLLDAFVVRTVLVPSLMHAIGKANWWVPRWLDRVLPNVSIEAANVEPEAGQETKVLVEA